LACWFWRFFKKNFCIFLLFHYYLPLERDNPIHLNKLKFPPPKDDFLPSLVTIGQVVLEEKIFLITASHSYIFVIISTLKRTWPYIYTDLNFLPPKDSLYKVWMNLACWFWRFYKNFSVFLFFCYYLPLEKGYPLLLNKLDTLQTRMICGSLVKIGLVVLEKKSKM
jgi:hypothetical protein